MSIMSMIDEHVDIAEYNNDEEMILEQGRSMFGVIEKMAGYKKLKLKLGSPLTEAVVVHKKQDGHAWGRSSATVRASSKEVLAFLWDVLSRENTKTDEIEKTIDENRSTHNKRVYTKKAMGKNVKERDFLTRYIWKMEEGEENESYILITRPEESERRPILGGVVRGELPSAMKIVNRGENLTMLEYVICYHFEANSKRLANQYTASYLSCVEEIQQYFQGLRTLDQYDASDGKALGYEMVSKTKQKERQEKGKTLDARVRFIVERNKGLKELAEKHEFFVPMMTAVITNRWT